MLSAVGVVVGAGNLAFNVIMARLAGAAAYGSIGALLAVSTVAGFLAVGIQYALARRVAAGTAHPADLLRITPRAAAAVAAVLAALAAGALPAAVYLQLSGPAPVFLTVLLIAVLTTAAIPTGVAIGLRLFGSIAALQLAGVAVRLAAGVVLAPRLDPTDAALLATIAGGGTLAIGLTVIVLRESRSSPPTGRTTPVKGERLSLESSLGAVISAGLWALWSLPLVFARHGLKAVDAGDFAAVQILCSSILFVSGPVVSVFYPAVARLRNRGTMLLGLAITATLAAGGVAGLFLYGPFLLERIYGGRYAASAMLFLLLAVSAALVALTTYGFWMLRAVDHPWPSIGVAMVVALLVVIRIGTLAGSSLHADAIAAALGAVAGIAAFVGHLAWAWMGDRAG